MAIQKLTRLSLNYFPSRREFIRTTPLLVGKIHCMLTGFSGANSGLYKIDKELALLARLSLQKNVSSTEARKKRPKNPLITYGFQYQQPPTMIYCHKTCDLDRYSETICRNQEVQSGLDSNWVSDKISLETICLIEDFWSNWNLKSTDERSGSPSINWQKLWPATTHWKASWEKSITKAARVLDYALAYVRGRGVRQRFKIVWNDQVHGSADRDEV